MRPDELVLLLVLIFKLETNKGWFSLATEPES